MSRLISAAVVAMLGVVASGLNSAQSATADAHQALMRNAGVKQALTQIKAEDAQTFREQIELSQIPSPPFKEAVRAQEYLRRFQALGLKDAAIDAEGNVIGLRKGSGDGPLLVLAAHLDTVFPEGTDVTVKERDGRFYGRGLGDDGRGLTTVLTVLRAMQSANIRTVGDVLFVGTVGEEGLGDLRGVKALFRDRQNIDGFISVDTLGTNHILAQATGSRRWEFSFSGPGGHSFGAFGAPSAIHAMGRAIALIDEVRPPADPKTTFTVGVVSGGTSVNTIAADAKMLIDMRSNSAAALGEIEKQIQAAAEQAVKDENTRWSSTGIKVEMKLLGDRPAGMQPAETPIVRAAHGSSAALKLPKPTLGAASTDSNVAISLGIPAATLGGGGEGGGAHSPDEWYKPVDAWLGPQSVLLTTLALVGVDKVSQPQLPKRAK